MLALHTTHPPPYFPGALLPGPAFVAALGSTRRAVATRPAAAVPVIAARTAALAAAVRAVRDTLHAAVDSCFAAVGARTRAVWDTPFVQARVAPVVAPLGTAAGAAVGAGSQEAPQIATRFYCSTIFIN